MKKSIQAYAYVLKGCEIYKHNATGKKISVLKVSKVPIAISEKIAALLKSQRPENAYFSDN